MKIAAICAFPAGLNPGMLSVDLAMQGFLDQQLPGHQTTLFCAEAAVEVEVAQGGQPLVYQHLQSVDQLRGFDRILYWGDFLHWLGYGARDFVKRQMIRSPALSAEQALEPWYRLMLLEGSPELHARTVVFGSTLYGLHAGELAQPRYAAAIVPLYAAARAVLMRDVYSANAVAQFAGRRGAHFGCDCAWLLDSGPLVRAAPVTPPRTPPAGKTIAIAFGRSGAGTALRAFAAVIARLSGSRLVDLAWFDRSGVAGLSRKLAQLQACDLVLTDIYHLGVSALRERKPVLCFGRGTSAVAHSLSDKKKEVFFTQSLLAPHYVYVENVLDALQSDASTLALANTCLATLQAAAPQALAHQAMERQVRWAGQQLAAALGGADPG